MEFDKILGYSVMILSGLSIVYSIIMILIGLTYGNPFTDALGGSIFLMFLTIIILGIFMVFVGKSVSKSKKWAKIVTLIVILIALYVIFIDYFPW